MKLHFHRRATLIQNTQNPQITQLPQRDLPLNKNQLNNNAQNHLTNKMSGPAPHGLPLAVRLPRAFAFLASQFFNKQIDRRQSTTSKIFEFYELKKIRDRFKSIAKKTRGTQTTGLRALPFAVPFPRVLPFNFQKALFCQMPRHEILVN